MENPEVTVLKGQVVELQSALQMVIDMLQTNLPNVGFGNARSNVYSGLSMVELIRLGAGPVAYNKWLRDDSFKPLEFEDYPGIYTSKAYTLKNRLIKEFVNHFGTGDAFANSTPKPFESKPLGSFISELKDGFYHIARGYSTGIGREDQGVLLTSGGTRRIDGIMHVDNLTRIYFPFSERESVKIFVYVPIEDCWVQGHWEHVCMDELEKVVETFMKDYRPPAVDGMAIKGLFDGLDLTDLFGEPEVVSLLSYERDYKKVSPWTRYLLDTLDYRKEELPPRKSYLIYRRGVWAIRIRMDDEYDVGLLKIPTWTGEHTSFTGWNDLNSSLQWSIYDQMRCELAKLIESKKHSPIQV